MTKLLILLLRINIQATLFLLFILLLRCCLPRVSKRYVCLLWLLLLIRLLCPFSIESPFALVPQLADTSTTTGEISPPAGEESNAQASPSHAPGISLEPESMSATGGARSPYLLWQLPICWLGLWLIGVMGLGIRYLLQYVQMKRGVQFAIRLEKNIWECEGLACPFIMGCWRPQIYLPFALSEEQRKLILAHENMHIQHHDPLLYFLALLVTCLHWWNPFVWLASNRMKADWEMFCDEAALLSANRRMKKQYAETLLQFAGLSHGLAPALSFGQSLTEKRIWYIFNAKPLRRPGKVLLITGICVCALQLVSVSSQYLLPIPFPTAYPTANSMEEGWPRGEVVWDAQLFAQQIMDCIRENDAQCLATLLHYPFITKVNGVRFRVSGADEFVQIYAQLITEATRTDILDSAITELFSNQYGYMMGQGSVWFSSFPQEGLKIYAINSIAE